MMTNLESAEKMAGEITEAELTCSRWYDGSLTLWQPRRGFRATTDAVLAAAAVDGECRHVVELGAGGGAASLALARRCPGMRITAIERDRLMASLLERNITKNSMAEQMTAIAADFRCDAKMTSLVARCDHVFFNPPYNDEASSLSSDARRRAAMAGDDVSVWLAAAARLLVARGGVTLISRSDRLDTILAGLAAARFGDVSIRAVHTQASQPALRVLVSARKASKSPLTLLPPLVLRDENNALTASMTAISDSRAAIDMKPPGRKRRAPTLPPALHDDLA